MAYANLNLGSKTIDGFDSIVIVKDLSDIPAGVALNVEGWPYAIVKAGTLLVEKDGEVSPLKYADGEYEALPEGAIYYGISKTSVSINNALVGVLRAGVVNAAAAKAEIAEYPSDAKEDLKLIDFIY